MTESFSQKEMLIRMMNKLDTIEGKLIETHELAQVTNGKVKLHTKLIIGIFGALSTIFTWIIMVVLK